MGFCRIYFHTSVYPVSLCIVDHFDGSIIFLLSLLQKYNWITFIKHKVDPQSYKADTSILPCIISTIYDENL